MATLSPTVPTAGAVPHVAFRPRRAGLVARVIAGGVIAVGIAVQPLVWSGTYDSWIAKAAIFAIIGLSVNVITGHAGQISLGHQAFVGIGAFMSAFVIARLGGFFPSADNLGGLPPLTIATTDFWFGVVAAGLVGAIMALILGMAALRIRGLYLALITLAFGLMAENSVFNWRAFTGGGAGLPAPRPVLFESDQAYAYLCLAFVGLFLFVDWRLVRTRAGRAIVALRNEERVAATLGINVTRYKLLAFATGGLMAGVAGALFAHWNQAVQALDFILPTALVWILMAVVGGLGSRAGVVIGSAFFALFDLVIGSRAKDATIALSNELAAQIAVGGVALGVIGAVISGLRRTRLPSAASLGIGLGAGAGFFLLATALLRSTFDLSGRQEILVQILTPFLGALLLLLTITLYPGGIGQQILPIRRWLAGGPLVESKHELQLAGMPLLVTFIVLLLAGRTWTFSLAAGLAAAAVTVVLLILYLRRLERTLRTRPAPEAEAEATSQVIPGPRELAEREPRVEGKVVEVDDLTTPIPSAEAAPPGSSGSSTAKVPGADPGTPAESGARASRFSALRRRRSGS